ncbi:MAG TPA: hypothetical protein VF990_03900 [Candidatus Dormibacteraeota bacterium]
MHSVTLALGPLQRLPQGDDGGPVLVVIRSNLNRHLAARRAVFDPLRALPSGAMAHLVAGQLTPDGARGQLVARSRFLDLGQLVPNRGRYTS